MESMSEEGTGVSREFMLKQIENEIQAARKALHLTDGESRREPAESEAEQVRALTRQVVELREAVEALAAGTGK